MSVMTVNEANEALDTHNRPWTVEELLARDERPSRDRVELIGGTLLVSPAPMWPHQAASAELWLQIRSAIRAAKAPYRVAEGVNIRSKDELFIPDIVVVESSAVSMDTVCVDINSALLVVEIVSPGNAAVDRLVKPNAYARLGLPHYWRLEPSGPEPRLIVHTLDGSHYREVDNVTDTAVVSVGSEFDVEIDVPQLFADLTQE